MTNYIKYLWQKLEDVPINNNGEIEERFLHFEIGTDRLDIWRWFEKNPKIKVINLMNNCNWNRRRNI